MIDSSVRSAQGTLFRSHNSTLGSQTRYDFGIGSFIMESKDLDEGSTLKARELLPAGIPTYFEHKNFSFPEHFSFYVERQDLLLKLGVFS